MGEIGLAFSQRAFSHSEALVRPGVEGVMPVRVGRSTAVIWFAWSRDLPLDDRQHFLNFFPLPQGHGSFRPTPLNGFSRRPARARFESDGLQ